MKPLTPSSLLPDFVAEPGMSDAERVQLAELFARLGSPLDSDQALLARGRARLLATVSHSEERFAPLFDKLTRLFDLGADSLRSILTRAAGEPWEPGPLPWVSLFHFQGGPAVAGLDTGFVRLRKGMAFPLHRHLGEERVLILEGGYFDHEQRWFGPGDFHDMPEGTRHSLQMNVDQDVLLAVVMTGQIEVVTGP